MNNCKKFWLENIKCLFNNISLIPKDSMDLEEQMNSLTRLILSIYIILYIMNYKNSMMFLLLSLSFIIILYYIQRDNMTTKENFTFSTPMQKLDKAKKITDAVSMYEDKLNPPNRKWIFCNDEYTLNTNGSQVGDKRPDTFLSINQALVGDADPRTKIAPIIINPIADLNYWKKDNFSVFSKINEQKARDLYQSGYDVSVKCDRRMNNEKPRNMIGFKNSSDVVENYEVIPNNRSYINFEENNIETGDLITIGGYDPEQPEESNLPVNFPGSSCGKQLKNYNKNIFKSIITPGNYFKTEVVEPVSSNIGISFTSQFDPITYEKNGDDITFTQRNPRTFNMKPKEREPENPREDNVYDPRYSGYGTSYRTYNDKMTNRNRFYYNDIDSIRRPNYITRNNIDFMKESSTYGPMPSDSEIYNNNLNIRENANNEFMKDAIQFRDDIQLRAMRKANSIAWEKKRNPISRGQISKMSYGF